MSFNDYNFSLSLSFLLTDLSVTFSRRCSEIVGKKELRW